MCTFQCLNELSVEVHQELYTMAVTYMIPNLLSIASSYTALFTILTASIIRQATAAASIITVK